MGLNPLIGSREKNLKGEQRGKKYIRGKKALEQLGVQTTSEGY